MNKDDELIAKQEAEIASLKLRIDTEYIKTEVHEALMTAESSVSQQRIEELKAEHEKWDALASRENERLQTQVKELEKRNDYLLKAQASTYRDGELLRAQVKELKAQQKSTLILLARETAQVKELEAALKEALEYLQREGTPYVNSAIATLQENE